MAKEEKAQKNTEGNEDLQTPKKKLPIKVIIIVLAVVLMEVGTILFFKMSNKPEEVEGDTAPIDPTAKIVEAAESELMVVEDLSVDNWTTGKTKYIVNFSVAIKVENAVKEKMTEKLTQHQSEIKQILGQIVGKAEPSMLKDPERIIIARQMKAELDAIIGEDVIVELLIPTWSAMPVE